MTKTKSLTESPCHKTETICNILATHLQKVVMIKKIYRDLKTSNLQISILEEDLSICSEFHFGVSVTKKTNKL